MRDLSLKGVAAWFGGTSGDFSVVNAIFGVPAVSGTVSLRSQLESIARQERSFDVSECVYEWTASYLQTWTHVVIRVLLLPDPGIQPAMMDALRTTWLAGIQSTWNDRWLCSRPGELPCRLSFEVQWGGRHVHHIVRVRPGPDQTDMTTWDTSDDGSVAAHEFGHMHGNPDEYEKADCPFRNPVNTGTVMDDNSPNVPARLVERLADHLGGAVIPP